MEAVRRAAATLRARLRPGRHRLGVEHEWQRRSRRLWIISGVFGAVTIYAAVAAVHDADRQQAGIRAVVHAVTTNTVARASSRLDVLALESFGGPSHEPYSAADPERSPQALASAHAGALRCRCRAVLPFRTFFRFDPASKRLELASVATDSPSPPPIQQALLEIVGAAAAGPPDLGGHVAQLRPDDRLGSEVAVTVARFDSTGRAVVVYGGLANAHAAAAALFVVDHAAVDRALNDPLVRLDDRALSVRDHVGRPLLGSVTLTGHMITTIRDHAMGGWAVSSVVNPRQLASTAWVSAGRGPRWHLALLILCTTIVITLAASSSRREVLLLRARSDFIAGVSHDLRMPLAEILLASETLIGEPIEDETIRARFMNTILREARRVIGVIENVLLFSRTAAARPHLRVEPVAVGDLFADVSEALALAAEAAGQQIEIDDMPELSVYGDRRLLVQALVNLVDNSLKYGERGQRVRLSAVELSGQRVRLIVDDEGPGIPAADRPAMLKPYTRLARDQESERTGTGLGLAVVQQIVTMCRGRVSIEDGPSGSGARVSLELRSASDVPSTLNAP